MTTSKFIVQLENGSLVPHLSWADTIAFLRETADKIEEKLANGELKDEE